MEKTNQTNHRLIDAPAASLLKKAKNKHKFDKNN
jgi:hypothetical protein